MLLMHEAFIDGLLHHLLKGSVIVSCIQKHDRVGLERKPFPGQGFQQFFESSRSSRQGDDAVGFFDHLHFPLMETGNNFQLAQGRVTPLEFLHKLMEHSDHSAFGF